MSRYVSLEQFRQRFEVVPTDDLSARDPTAREPTAHEPREEPTSREPTKYFDPFAEREDV